MYSPTRTKREDILPLHDQNTTSEAGTMSHNGKLKAFNWRVFVFLRRRILLLVSGICLGCLGWSAAQSFFGDVQAVAIDDYGEVTDASYQASGKGSGLDDVYAKERNSTASLFRRQQGSARLEAVHDAIVHAWDGYKHFSWGIDELQPETRRGTEWFGLGLTLVDSLDTLFIAGEIEEFLIAREWVETYLDVSRDVHVNVFEVTIRILGGLLSAYQLSREEIFLSKAIELGDNLRHAFKSKSGIPFSDMNLHSKEAFAPEGAPDSSLSEAASIQLELKYLAYLTDDPKLFIEAHQSMWALEKARQKLSKEFDGLAPMYINANSGQFRAGSTITLGARGDSYYEYLLKQWLLTGKIEKNYLDRYNEAVNAIRTHLLKKSIPSGYAYIGEILPGNQFSPKMDHLVCYLPGTLALGYFHGCDMTHMAMATELMRTCFEMYNTTATGLAPEIVYFNTNPTDKNDIIIQPRDTHYILRPEVVESLFYMYKITKNPVYQDWGWKIFEAIERHCRVETGGYSGINNVNDLNSPKTNKMESFFLAETLKYLYLLFLEEDLISLDKFVLNTEAHPIPIFRPKWKAMDIPDERKVEEEASRESTQEVAEPLI